MSRQVRIDDDLATWLEDRYPTASLSSGACRALSELRDRGTPIPASTAAASATHASGPVTPVERTEFGDDPAAAAADRARARALPSSQCRHPIEYRVGIRCGLCGSAPHAGPRPR